MIYLTLIRKGTMNFAHMKNSRIKVLMVNWLYPPEFSGAASQCRTLVNELTRHGVEVEVLAGTNLPTSVGTDFVDGIKVHRLLCDKSNRRRSGKYAFDMFSYIFKNRAKYNIIHSHGFIAQANLAARVTALPLVVKITNLNVDDPFYVSKRSMGRALLSLYRKTTAVVATSPLLFDISNRTLNKGVRVEHIPNGVDLNRFSPATTNERRSLRSKLGIGQDDIVLLFVGTICHTKGLDLLVEAMKHIVAYISRKVRLLVVGPDEYMRAFGDHDAKVAKFAKQLRQEVDNSDLRDVVRFEGRQDNVEEYYKAADIFVHPSRREGQPNAIIEAMASGLPVVANYIAGITTEMVVHGHTGFVVKCEDSQLLTHTILSLVDNDALRQQIGRNACKNAIARYDICDVALRYLSLYRGIVHRYDQIQLIPGYHESYVPVFAQRIAMN